MTNAQIVRLWDAINAVVTASGGNPGNTSVARQRAVVAVESVVTGIEDTIRHGARAACKRLREERDEAHGAIRFTSGALDKAVTQRDAARLELRALEWLHEQYDEDYPHDWFYRGSVVWTMSADGLETEHATYASAARALGWEG